MSDADAILTPRPAPPASPDCGEAEAPTVDGALQPGPPAPSLEVLLPSPADVDALVASAVRRIAERVMVASAAAETVPSPIEETVALPPDAPPPVADQPTDEATGAAEAPAPDEPDREPNQEVVDLAPEVAPPSDAPPEPPATAPASARPETTALRPLDPVAAVDPAPPPAGAAPGDATPHAAPSRWSWRRIARLAGLGVAGYFGLVFALILLYRFVNPPTTTLIAYQWLTGTSIEQSWVPIEDISPNLLRAVVVSEDWGFCDHYGVDLVAIETALEQAGEGSVPRGASTISMQVIKNLFLSQSKSYLRKAVEIPLTFVAEAVWPKSRMLEIYLNIAEWGPGVFGAEAAARHHFSKPAAKLSEREATLLAAALPNPILRDAGDPGTRTARKARVIQSRMHAAGPVADCAMPPRKPANKGPGWQTTVKKRAGAAP